MYVHCLLSAVSFSVTQGSGHPGTAKNTEHCMYLFGRMSLGWDGKV